ncbi:response regulator [Cohnella caldifontis]|uniref:response regulator n=1 Tax=Cohnella caldifontis TaxID=3027471 RepID=UPI0023ED98D5|nr:response regulator [Cohnella sp. YIM B05605]
MRNTVLVADDSREIVRMIADELERENFGVLCAYDGKQALQAMMDKHVDSLILDIMMPGMDGLEVCRRLGNERNIPILLLSARDREMDRIIGLEVGQRAGLS